MRLKKVYRMIVRRKFSTIAKFKSGKRVRIEFRNEVKFPEWKGGKYVTSDPEVQKWLEIHSFYGRWFICETPEPKPEPQEEEKFIDEVTGKEYKTASALKTAITKREKAEKKDQ